MAKDTAKKPTQNSGISGSKLLGVYIITGFIVATIQVLIWKWPITALFSPTFYVIVITWPLYIFGLLGTILNWALILLTERTLP